ncbi:unnamed protein product [Leuciscus chuanchicus]
METGLSAWSDEVVTLQTTVNTLKTEVAELRDKCEDLEGRARRCNIRILGVPETPGSNSTTSVSKLLREALQLDKDVLIDRSHRSLAPRKPGGKPRAIVAKLHYFQDCVEVLNRARTRAPLRYNGESIAIFPDYTSRVAKARAAFTEVRKLLHNRQNVRFGILFPARLRVTHNGEEKEFTDAEKAMTYVRNHINHAEERAHQSPDDPAQVYIILLMGLPARPTGRQQQEQPETRHKIVQAQVLHQIWIRPGSGGLR